MPLSQLFPNQLGKEWTGLSPNVLRFGPSYIIAEYYFNSLDERVQAHVLHFEVECCEDEIHIFGQLRKIVRGKWLTPADTVINAVLRGTPTPSLNAYIEHVDGRSTVCLGPDWDPECGVPSPFDTRVSWTEFELTIDLWIASADEIYGVKTDNILFDVDFQGCSEPPPPLEEPAVSIQLPLETDYFIVEFFIISRYVSEDWLPDGTMQATATMPRVAYFNFPDPDYRFDLTDSKFLTEAQVASIFSGTYDNFIRIVPEWRDPRGTSTTLAEAYALMQEFLSALDDDYIIKSGSIDWDTLIQQSTGLNAWTDISGDWYRVRYAGPKPGFTGFMGNQQMNFFSWASAEAGLFGIGETYSQTSDLTRYLSQRGVTEIELRVAIWDAKFDANFKRNLILTDSKKLGPTYGIRLLDQPGPCYSHGESWKLTVEFGINLTVNTTLAGYENGVQVIDWAFKTTVTAFNYEIRTDSPIGIPILTPILNAVEQSGKQLIFNVLFTTPNQAIQRVLPVDISNVVTTFDVFGQQFDLNLDLIETSWSVEIWNNNLC